jgi:hypothetical protein
LVSGKGTGTEITLEAFFSALSRAALEKEEIDHLRGIGKQMLPDGKIK